jgi:hypothetical protein
MSCSFCSCNLHNITNCNSEMIGVLYERIQKIYMDIIRQYHEESEMRFKSAINRRFNAREIRGVGVRYTHAFARSSKQSLVNSLWQYFSSRISLPVQTDNEGWLEVRRLPTHPDIIPDFASDLEQVNLEEEPEDITWYIDSTPSLISVPRLNLLWSSQLPRNFVHHQSEYNLDTTRTHGIVAPAPQIKKYNIIPVLVLNDEEEFVKECSICYEDISSIYLVKLGCAHYFCGVCIKGWLNAHNNIRHGPTCALCRAPMENFSVKNQEIYNLVSEHCYL